MGFDWTPGRRDAAMRFARMPPPSEVHSTFLGAARSALSAQRVSAGPGSTGLDRLGRSPDSFDLCGYQIIHQDEAWLTLRDEVDVRLSALVGRYVALRRHGRVEAIRRAADLVSAFTASAVLACATLSLRHMLHIHSRHPSRHPAPSQRRDDDDVDHRAFDGTGTALFFSQMYGGYEQALWLRCAAAPLLKHLAAKAAAATSAAPPSACRRQGCRRQAAYKRAAAAAKRGRIAAIFGGDPLAQFLEATRVTQEEVMSCVLAARAQLAERRRATPSVAYRAAAAAAAVAAGAAIMAHNHCDDVDFCIRLHTRRREEVDEWRAVEHGFSNESETWGEGSPLEERRGR
jgi:hypothetical protein